MSEFSNTSRGILGQFCCHSHVQFIHRLTTLGMIVHTTIKAQPRQVDQSASNPPFPGGGDFFRMAIEAARLPVLVTDPNQADNPVVYTNQAFMELTGYTASEVLGRNCRFLQGPETDATAIACVRQAIAEHREVQVELINYRKDGTAFWNALSISPVFNDAHELTHFFASHTDVTHRRHAEEALDQAHKMETLGRLTGGIAHDFNNLLQVMSGYLDIIERTATKPMCDEQRIARSAARARDAADRATMLTQQLLAFSGKQRLTAESLNINSLIASADRLAKQPLSGIALQTDLAANLWNCHIDPARTEMALLNILINSRDALSGRSNPTISIETHNVAIQGPPGVPAWAGLLPGRYISVAISDNGAGIPESVLDRVMDPFFSTKGEGRGTGLGLSSVYGFILQSGGTVRIYSEENVGTTVRLYFPAEDGSQGTATVHAAASSLTADTAHGTESILIVEDRPDVAELACIILTGHGYRPQIAHNAEDAWSRLENGQCYDLLFSDLIMPGQMNGAALARKVTERHPQVRILLTTGYADNLVECTNHAGAEYEMIAKPYLPDELVCKVRAVLDGRAGPAGKTD